jgi:hypothetical protein
MLLRSPDRAEERIAVFRGPTPLDKREAIKLALNEHTSKDPLRILLCNDAAREELNLQAHCFNLFHFDVPWNPSRLEQRNGRIDRKLQSSDARRGAILAGASRCLFYPRIEQGGIILKSSKDLETARAFRDFVLGDNGREVLEHYGFYLPGK